MNAPTPHNTGNAIEAQFLAPETHPRSVGKKAGETASEQAVGEKPVVPFMYLPLPIKVAIEIFAASGARTEGRLFGLIDFFLTGYYGTAVCDERALYRRSAVACARGRGYLPEDVGAAASDNSTTSQEH